MDPVRFFFELGILKHMQRTGWIWLGELEGDSVAAHSFRVSIIAYYLANKLNLNAEKAAVMALFHDLHETRLWDLNPVTKKYAKINEERAYKSVIRDIPELKGSLELWKEYHERKSDLAKVVKDADLLDLIFQALYYARKGNKLAYEFAQNAYGKLHFPESRELADLAFHYKFTVSDVAKD